MSETAQKSPWRQTPSKGGGGDFEVPPADNHLARLVAMVDLGTQQQRHGDEVREQHKVYLAWELLGCTMSGSKFNHVIGERYTLSLNEKAHLARVARALLGKEFREDRDNDLDRMLGRPCMVEVLHVPGRTDKTKTYANVATVSSVPAALAKHGVPEAMRGPLLWSLGDDLAALEKADWLPWCYGERLHEVVAACRELSGQRVGGNRGAALQAQEAARQERYGKQPAGAGAHGTSNEDPIPFALGPLLAPWFGVACALGGLLA